jgi:AcrR family transcriptional regulator
MREDFGSVSEPGVLTPSIPRDIGARSQRRRILESMAASCNEKTFSATTIADIVSHASISRATFYKHYTNKRECFDAAADNFLADLQGVATEAYSGDGTYADSVRSVVGAALEHLVTKPAQANLLLVEAPIVDPEIVRRIRNLTLDAMATQPQTGDSANHPFANPEIAFGRAAVLIADFLAADRVKELPTLLPELTYIALLPSVGHRAALAQAKVGR